MKCKSNFYPSNKIRIFNEGITIKFYKGDIIKFNQPLLDPFEEIQIKRFIPNEELYICIEDADTLNIRQKLDEYIKENNINKFYDFI